eukprot:COSAG05_NODE_4311_length_1570_cov_1.990483_3_plen_70_part_00
MVILSQMLTTWQEEKRAKSELVDRIHKREKEEVSGLLSALTLEKVEPSQVQNPLFIYPGCPIHIYGASR